MNNYDHAKIEKKWRKAWDEKKTYKTLSAKQAKAKKLKPYYVLDMFPYPSGAGLHVGHPRGYIASDVLARMKRMQGYNVLHPMGFDSFGLPAEQYAIKTGKNPGPFTNQLVKRYREQLSILGFSFDWDRQVATHDPDYYRWTQWIFLQVYGSYYDLAKGGAQPIEKLEGEFSKNGNAKVLAVCDADTPAFSAADWKRFSDLERQNVLMKYRLAYEGFAEVNWCAELGTVLANDEVIEKDGRMVSERGEHPVVKRQMRQWFMRITAYADRLLSGLDTIDWPHSIKEIQRNWIGKSEGSEITFSLGGSEEKITVFTTRADTLFGVTYVVLAPEHELVQQLKPQIKNWAEVERYIADVKTKSDEDRVAAKEKTGVELRGVHAVNPANGEQVPVWVADYVLATYGTGAVMAVPAHDERDFDFAKKYNLPMKEVVVPNRVDEKNPPVAGKRTGERRNVQAIVRDPRTDTYLFLYSPQYGWTTLPMGGVEEGEDFIEAARREVAEESGFLNLNYVKTLGGTVRAEYFAAHKDENRVAFTRAVMFDLADDARGALAAEEEGKHEIKWLPRSEIVYPRIVHAELNDWLARWDRGDHAYTEYGTLLRSGRFDGMASQEARRAITKFVGGRPVTKYRMRDAIFARQRYWGEPIPLRHEQIQPEIEIEFFGGHRFGLLRSGIKTVESRALDKKERKSVKVGDLIKFYNTETKESFFSVVKELWHLKNVKDAFEKMNKHDLFEEVFPGESIETVEDLYRRYKNVGFDYDKRIDAFGAVAWRVKNISCGEIIQPVPEKSLPLKLPNVTSYAPTGDGQSPLAGVKAWVKAGYETNTMPGWAGSSWYFLRYADPKNKKAFAGEGELDYWFGKNGGVDMYVGGAEHATGHLLYARFWHKFLRDLGHVKPEEPFQSLRNQGMIGGADGRKMSKRWGNVINPDDVVRDLGADTLRVYESFMGPFEAHLPWSTDGVAGSRRFIERVWKLQAKVSAEPSSTEVRKALHRMIRKVSDDIPAFAFNTAVSAMMIFLNVAEKAGHVSQDDFLPFLKALAPFAPHVTEELWSRFGGKGSIHRAAWPKYDPRLVIEDSVTLGIQVNGKVRAEITVALDAAEADVREKVLQIPDVQKWIEGRTVRKFIYVPGRVISIVA